MRHSESSPDLNSASVATFLPSNPFLVVFVLTGVIFSDCFFLVLYRAVSSGIGDYSSFPSVIKICFSYVDRGSVAFLYLFVCLFVCLLGKLF